jgi:ankyrin repeat protein
MPPPPALKSFIQAIRSADTPTIRSLAAADPTLIKTADPNSFGATPLIHAIGTDDRGVVDLLLDLGADINQRSDWWAGSFGVLDSASDDLSEHLLSRGATLTPHAAARLGKLDRLRAMLDENPALIHARGGDGQTPLHFARTIPIADLLLSRGANIDALDIDHASTPVHWLGDSRPEVAAHLVKRGAAPDPFLAVRIADTALLQELLKTEPDGINVRVTRARFSVAPPAAGHIYLYTIGEHCGLVHAAANQPAVIPWLAAHGADINARGGYDNATPLHFAAWSDKPATAAALLDSGADIDAPSGPIHHNQPIGWAIVSGALETFRLLLARGATLHPHHLEDAHKAANGAFRHFNPRRPLDAWRQIDQALSHHPRP